MESSLFLESTASPLEAAKRSIGEDGFFILEDPAMGEPVLEMEQRHFTFFTEHGLDFCRRHVLYNPRVRPTILAYFQGKRCILGHWLRYEAYPGHIVCFRRGGPKAGAKVLMVQLWPKGSQAVYYHGSHLHELPTEEGRRSLHEISPSALADAGCEATEENFDEGGMAILDSRTAFEMKAGYSIIFEFGTEDVVGRWHPMDLPNLDVLVGKVADMESPEIGLNFKYEELPSRKR